MHDFISDIIDSSRKDNISQKTFIDLSDTDEIRIDDIQMTGKEFKTCMKYLYKLTKENLPEEFI